MDGHLARTLSKPFLNWREETSSKVSNSVEPNVVERFVILSANREYRLTKLTVTGSQASTLKGRL